MKLAAKIPMTLALGLIALSTSALAAAPGPYANAQPDGSTDFLTINSDKSVSYELTRQVGGPGGISNDGVVPYPTVCRVKQWGRIISENASTLTYQVRFVHVTDLSGLSDTKNCARYVDEFNGRALTSQMTFSIEKADLKIGK